MTNDEILAGAFLRVSKAYLKTLARYRGWDISGLVHVVNNLLAEEDPIALANWWCSPSERLGGRCPSDMLGHGGDDDRLLLQLAGAENEPIG